VAFEASMRIASDRVKGCRETARKVAAERLAQIQEGPIEHVVGHIDVARDGKGGRLARVKREIGRDAKKILERGVEVGHRPLPRANFKDAVAYGIEADLVAEVEQP
jgi:hypothetical protein